MFFSISRRPAASPISALTIMVTAVIAVILLLAPASRAFAKEATARGKKAIITWIDEQGVRKEGAAREIFYRYYLRTYLQVPKDGKNFKDDLRTDKGIPLAGDFTSFVLIDRVDFSWETDPVTEISRLAVKVTLSNGTVRQGSGTSLAGASHPTSPYLSFTVDGKPHQIDLHPLSSAAERAGKPMLVSMRFTL